MDSVDNLFYNNLVNCSSTSCPRMLLGTTSKADFISNSEFYAEAKNTSSLTCLQVLFNVAMRAWKTVCLADKLSLSLPLSSPFSPHFLFQNNSSTQKYKEIFMKRTAKTWKQLRLNHENINKSDSDLSVYMGRNASNLLQLLPNDTGKCNIQILISMSALGRIICQITTFQCFKSASKEMPV